MEEKTKVEKLEELARQVPDPVFRNSILRIVEAMKLGLKFKRLDMAFLQNVIAVWDLTKLESFVANEMAE